MPAVRQSWLVLVVLFSAGTFFVNDRYHVQLRARPASREGQPSSAPRKAVETGQQDTGGRSPSPLRTVGAPLSPANAGEPGGHETEASIQVAEEKKEEEGDAGLSEMFAAAAAAVAVGDETGAEVVYLTAAVDPVLASAIQPPARASQDAIQGAKANGAPLAERMGRLSNSLQMELQDWLHPGPGIKARPESEYVPLTMTRESLERRGAFFVPKVDNPEERVWPPPGVKLQGSPTSRMYAKEWNHARGHVWRKLLRLLPASDPGKAWKYRSCAVVGNGGSVLLYAKGEEISMHDAIFRFNRGVRKGFEQYVGNRTTIRIVNRNNLGFYEEGDGIILQQVTAPDAFEGLLNVTSSPPAGVPVYGIATEFHELVLERYRKLLQGTNADLQSLMGWRYQGEKLKWDSPATNGFYGVTLALQRCARVSLYGFARTWGTPSTSSPQLKLKYHYYDGEEPIKAQSQRDTDEFIGLASLVRVLRRRIRFAEPCIAGCTGKMVDSSRDPSVCPQCPSGSWCSCSAWHPVPRPGFCFFLGGGASGLRCFHKCLNSKLCPGGHLGVCPSDPSLYQATCH